MPIFEYRCEKCGKEFEEVVFKDNEAVACPACGSTQTGKLMSCCRHKNAANARTGAAMPRSGGGCSSCSGGNCSTCG